MPRMKMRSLIGRETVGRRRGSESLTGRLALAARSQPRAANSRATATAGAQSGRCGRERRDRRPRPSPTSRYMSPSRSATSGEKTPDAGAVDRRGLRGASARDSTQRGGVATPAAASLPQARARARAPAVRSPASGPPRPSGAAGGRSPRSVFSPPSAAGWRSAPFGQVAGQPENVGAVREMLGHRRDPCARERRFRSDRHHGRAGRRRDRRVLRRISRAASVVPSAATRPSAKGTMSAVVEPTSMSRPSRLSIASASAVARQLAEAMSLQRAAASSAPTKPRRPQEGDGRRKPLCQSLPRLPRPRSRDRAKGRRVRPSS